MPGSGDVAREHDLIPNTLHMWLQNHPEDGRAVNAALLSGQADSPISALVHALINHSGVDDVPSR